jgi:hypothetical protein
LHWLGQFHNKICKKINYLQNANFPVLADLYPAGLHLLQTQIAVTLPQKEGPMNLPEAKTQLTTIRDNLPAAYSMSGARKLMAAFENYMQISKALGRLLPRTNSGIRSEFEDIEQEIRTAIKGTPKREAEASFTQAKRHITADINIILSISISSPQAPS